MNERTLLFLLLCGCALFGVAIAAELHTPKSEAAAGSAQAALRPAAAPLRAPRAPSLARLVTTTLARPLFSPTRRPPQQQKDGAGAGITDMRLTGIVTAPGTRFAIFAVTGAKPLTVKEGEDVSGWRIDSITPDAVSASGPGGAVTLRPKEDKNLVRTSLAAAVPAPTARFAGPAGPAQARFSHSAAGPGFSPRFTMPVRPVPTGPRQ